MQITNGVFSIFALTKGLCPNLNHRPTIKGLALTKGLPQSVFFFIFALTLTKGQSQSVSFYIFTLTLNKGLPQRVFSLLCPNPNQRPTTKAVFYILPKNSKWVWSGNTTITNCRLPRGTARKSRSTIMRHQEDKLSKAISSLFPIKMIAILEWT